MKKYNSSAKVYDQLYFEEQTRKKEKILSLNFKPYGRLLDLGCGTGISVIRQHPVEFSVGLDISIEMLKLAKDKGIEVILGDMTSTPFRNESFDCLTMVTSFHHVPRKGKVINELIRIMKPGGKIAASLLKIANVNEQIKHFTIKRLKLVCYNEDSKDTIILAIKVDS